MTRYAIAYPDVVKAVGFHQSYHSAKERSGMPGQEGKALVGFGKYRSMTLQDLYASKDKEIIRYDRTVSIEKERSRSFVLIPQQTFKAITLNLFCTQLCQVPPEQEVNL